MMKVGAVVAGVVLVLLLYLGGNWYLASQDAALAKSAQATLSAQLETKTQRVNELEANAAQAALAADETAKQMALLSEHYKARDAAFAANDEQNRQLKAEVNSHKQKLKDLMKNENLNSCTHQPMPAYAISMLRDARAKNTNTLHHQN
jgi:chromosome segregation ATPase